MYAAHTQLYAFVSSPFNCRELSLSTLRFHHAMNSSQFNYRELNSNFKQNKSLLLGLSSCYLALMMMMAACVCFARCTYYHRAF